MDNLYYYNNIITNPENEEDQTTDKALAFGLQNNLKMNLSDVIYMDILNEKVFDPSDEGSE